MGLLFTSSSRVLTALGLLLLALATSPAQAQRAITVASTTSTEQSGLFKHILPKFTGSTGIEVRVVALGTGQALDIGRRADADVVFVHDREAEEKFVADGFGVTRREVMYNDFVVVGPKSDPAGAAGKDIQAALQRIAAGKHHQRVAEALHLIQQSKTLLSGQLSGVAVGLGGCAAVYTRQIAGLRGFPNNQQGRLVEIHHVGPGSSTTSMQSLDHGRK